jgi:hypothetical protein
MQNRQNQEKSFHNETVMVRTSRGMEEVLLLCPCENKENITIIVYSHLHPFHCFSIERSEIFSTTAVSMPTNDSTTLLKAAIFIPIPTLMVVTKLLSETRLAANRQAIHAR